MTYDVFISFKNSGKNGKPTPDAAAARKVHDALKAKGIKAFFSEESLAEKGQGHFGKSIESALDSARVLILVASCREHIESKWVETEWDSFLQDVRSGNKEGELFIFNCGDLKPAELPMFLRRQQMFPESSLDKMLTFVGSAMSPLPTLNDLIELSLHCFRPEKNEDKVYLVTVQQGASASTRNVAAHWGARSSKRLSSQLKAINVTVEAAHEEVEKAKQEKHRGGYAPASHVNLLTSEAWSVLSASLGLAEAPAREKKTGAAPKKGTAKLSATATADAVPVKQTAADNKKPPAKLAPAPLVAATLKAAAKDKPAAQAKVPAEPAAQEPAKLAAKTKPVAAVKTSAKPAVAESMPAKAKLAKATKPPEPPVVAAPVKPAAKSKLARASAPVTPVAEAVKTPEAAAKSRAAKPTAATPETAVAPEPIAVPAQAKPAAATKASTALKATPIAASAPAKAALSAPQVNKTVCISGKLPSGSKKSDYAAPLRAAGYELVDDVVKGLSYLVLADPAVVTGKSAKAKSMGVELLSEDQLKKLIS